MIHYKKNTNAITTGCNRTISKSRMTVTTDPARVTCAECVRSIPASKRVLSEGDTTRRDDTSSTFSTFSPPSDPSPSTPSYEAPSAPPPSFDDVSGGSSSFGDGGGFSGGGSSDTV